MYRLAQTMMNLCFARRKNTECLSSVGLCMHMAWAAGRSRPTWEKFGGPRRSVPIDAEQSPPPTVALARERLGVVVGQQQDGSPAELVPVVAAQPGLCSVAGEQLLRRRRDAPLLSDWARESQRAKPCL